MEDTSWGYLLIGARTADGVLLVPGAHVTVRDAAGVTIFDGYTNRDGYTNEIAVATPPKSESLIYGRERPFATVSVAVEKDGFYEVVSAAVPVFASVVTVRQVNLQPTIDEGALTWQRSVQYG